MGIQHKYVILMGDFNARTHNKPDFIDVDDFLSSHFEFDDNLLEFCNVSDKLDYFHFSRERTSQDVTVNNEGNVLLDMCKANNLFMLNGRCGDDKSVGALTFRNCSTIHY